MKFQTIVLTKKALVCAAAAVLGVSVIISSALWVTGNKSAEVFAPVSNGYSKILDEGLPSGNGISIKEIAGKILGFDAERPETIIEEYSSAFELSETESDLAPENSPDEPESGGETETNAIPELPTHEQICSASGLKINNATNYSVDLDALCAEELYIKPDSDEVQVLIVHTHTTECYDGDEMSGETERTTDESKNVIAVGNEICDVLESYGIKTLHDTTYHDYPSYQGSYTRALGTIESYLSEYPSIKAVLDIHRDAYVYSDGSKLTVSCDIDGISTAQVMLVTGTNSMGLWHDNWRENLKFAAKIQSAAEIMYPGLMRPVNLRTERFNGHTTMGSLILEVGSNGNTLDEAKEGGRDAARAIAAALLNG